MSAKVSKNFYDWEFVPPEIYHNKRLKNQWFISKFMIDFAQLLRERFAKPVFINTYLLTKSSVLTNGYENSGFRSASTKTGAKLSQHKFKCAIDAKISDIDPEEIRGDIRNNFAIYKAVGLTTIEKDTPTWVHGDCRHTGMNTLYEVKYK
ncbi:MAG: hypothetical protein GY710_03505 [Desulfobacteraceae bacterium]|nr:hypothetical protein [Desulfobacteraceae bacterium]